MGVGDEEIDAAGAEDVAAAQAPAKPGRPAKRWIGRRHIAEAAVAVVGEDLIPLGIIVPLETLRLRLRWTGDGAVHDRQVEMTGEGKIGHHDAEASAPPVAG